MKFADIRNDVTFRKVFGNKKKTHILISFLNAVLQLEGEKRIVKLKFENPYQFPSIKGDKSIIIDVRASEISGRQFIIEMQVAEVDGFDKRVQFYTSRDYAMQLKAGDDYTKLNPTVFVGILDFNFFKGSDYLSYHSLLDEKTLENKLKDLRFAFIELKKFNKKENELHSIIDKWVYFLKNAAKLNNIPENVDDEGLREAYNDANRHQWTKQELMSYDDVIMNKQDAKGMITLAERRAKEKGAEEGIEIGKEIGIEQGKEIGKEIGIEQGKEIGIEQGKEIGKEIGEKSKSIEIAMKLKQFGLSNIDIASSTGLSIEEVENLQ